MVKGADGQIISASLKELYSKYIYEEYFKQVSFGQFVGICRLNGIKITGEEEIK